MTELRDKIQAILATIMSPGTGENLLAAGAVRALTVENASVRFILDMPGLAQEDVDAVEAEIRARLSDLSDLHETKILRSVAHQSLPSDASDPAPKPLDGVRHVVFVGAGKGGVGKSTVTANLALAMAAQGLRVGVLDADVYGPSMPLMLGTDGRPVSYDGTLIPIATQGIKLMSLGLMMSAEQALIWRGPILANTLEQMLHQVRWAPLDVLFVDLPPGTGDVPLTIAQTVQVSGAVVVSTPQNVALMDARRAIDLFRRMDTPLLGLVENMSTHVCGTCGAEDHVFGTGLEDFAARQEIDFLGRLPLNGEICQLAECGQSPVVAQPESLAAQRFTGMATALMHRLNITP